MRFAFVLGLMVAGGALMGTTAQLITGPDGPNSASGDAHGFHWAKIDFKLADLNPLRLVFDEVQSQVQSNDNHSDFQSTPAFKPDFSAMDAQVRRNDENFRRMGGQGDISGLPASGPQ